MAAGALPERLETPELSPRSTNSSSSSSKKKTKMVQVEEMSFKYANQILVEGQEEKWAVRRMTFSLKKGECLSLLGPNG